MEGVYLIKPRHTRGDITYKVIDKDGYYYFCRCGGQFYDIDPEVAEPKKGYLTTQELLAHKDSFRLKKGDISGVKINSKRRKWTGSIPNNGSVVIMADKKHDFIIHAVNDYPEVQTFFEAVPYCPVTVSVDPKRAQVEKVYAEYKRRNPKIKKRIVKLSKILNTIGWIVGLWLIFFPRPYFLAIAAGIIMTLTALIFYARNEKYVSLDDNWHNPFTSVLTGIMVPAIGLALFVLRDVNIVLSWRVWVPAIVLAAIISVLVLYKTRERKKEKKVAAILLPVIAFLFSIGTVVSTNCVYDYHEPAQYSVRVQDKDYSKSNSSVEYSLIVRNWNETGSLTVRVSKSVYEYINIGSDVWLAVYPGLWGIEWYYVRSEAWL